MIEMRQAQPGRHQAPMIFVDCAHLPVQNIGNDWFASGEDLLTDANQAQASERGGAADEAASCEGCRNGGIPLPRTTTDA